MKLEPGCGTAPTPGYVHHDRRRHAPHIDVVHDLDAVPWPWARRELRGDPRPRRLRAPATHARSLAHRILAARDAGRREFPADVRPGTERDALLFSISCNGAHGLPRTNADKRKAVTLLLADAEWSQWSDREIARRCQVSHEFVSQVRRSASVNGSQMRPRKVRRGATIYEMRAETNSSQPAAPDRGVSTPAEAPSTPATDRLDILLGSETAAAFASLSVFETIEKLHAQLAELVDQLAQSPGGGAFQQHLVRKLKDGKLKFCSPELNVFLQN